MEPEEHFTAPAGWSIRHFPETASTNDLAKQAGEAGASERTIFVTDHQTLGRGRMDRRWLETPGSSLLFSILFRRYPSEPILLTMLCSVAACEAIEKMVPARVEIKWPNDLMMKGRKLAGVLTEVNWAALNRFAVVGMGINLNFDPAIVDGIPDNATSLLRETGAAVSRPRLLSAILGRLDELLTLSRPELGSVVQSRWATRLWRRRQRVTVADDGAVLEGVFEDVAPDGALLLRLDDGSVQTVRVGDLVI